MLLTSDNLASNSALLIKNLSHGSTVQGAGVWCACVRVHVQISFR